jgi:hypothetical protein
VGIIIVTCSRNNEHRKNTAGIIAPDRNKTQHKREQE